MFGQQPYSVRELALGGVDTADQDIEHQVDALHRGEPVAVGFGGEQLGDEVISRHALAPLEQRLQVGRELHARLLDPLALLGDAHHVELALHPV